MWGIIISIILFIIGFPGLLADMEVWRYDWMMDAQWWDWALMGAGLALFLYSVSCYICRTRKYFRLTG